MSYDSEITSKMVMVMLGNWSTATTALRYCHQRWRAFCLFDLIPDSHFALVDLEALTFALRRSRMDSRILSGFPFRGRCY
jgi:hypothetical protein